MFLVPLVMPLGFLQRGGAGTVCDSQTATPPFWNAAADFPKLKTGLSTGAGGSLFFVFLFFVFHGYFESEGA